MRPIASPNVVGAIRPSSGSATGPSADIGLDAASKAGTSIRDFGETVAKGFTLAGNAIQESTKPWSPCGVGRAPDRGRDRVDGDIRWHSDATGYAFKAGGKALQTYGPQYSW